MWEAVRIRGFAPRLQITETGKIRNFESPRAIQAERASATAMKHGNCISAVCRPALQSTILQVPLQSAMQAKTVFKEQVCARCMEVRGLVFWRRTDAGANAASENARRACAACTSVIRRITRRLRYTVRSAPLVYDGGSVSGKCGVSEKPTLFRLRVDAGVSRVCRGTHLAARVHH